MVKVPISREDKTKDLVAFERLLRVMDDLRENCPWDKKQTWETIRVLSIEEVFELSEAILSNKPQEIKGELGDLFLHLVFYAKIADEKKLFNVEDVLNAICDKLIERHPHIYGDVQINSEEEVKKNWEKIKLKKGAKGVLSGVPKGLPPISKAMRIQEKVAGVGFDWDNPTDVIEKVQEELNELVYEVKNNNKTASEEEFGDLLFSLINYARFIKVNPETALQKTNQKFINRFNLMEEKIKAANKDLTLLSLQEMDVYWEIAKNELKKV